MRIISGIAKGRKLLSPVGSNTRPTLDRIKESIFNILQDKPYDSIVIDVFSGTGSLGLEAASRGAEKCYLVDKNDDTYSILQKNVENLKFGSTCETLKMDSYEALSYLSNKHVKFDIIFIDPPYNKNMIPLAVEIISKKRLLNNNGVIVTKIDSKEIIYNGFEDIFLYDNRKYGNTIICFYRHKEE